MALEAVLPLAVFPYFIIHSLAVFGPNIDVFFSPTLRDGDSDLHLLIIACATILFFAPGIFFKMHSQRFDGPNIPARDSAGCVTRSKKLKIIKSATFIKKAFNRQRILRGENKLVEIKQMGQKSHHTDDQLFLDLISGEQLQTS
jgi:hypothetical protein